MAERFDASHKVSYNFFTFQPSAKSNSGKNLKIREFSMTLTHFSYFHDFSRPGMQMSNAMTFRDLSRPCKLWSSKKELRTGAGLLSHLLFFPLGNWLQVWSWLIYKTISSSYRSPVLDYCHSVGNDWLTLTGWPHC